MVLTPCSAPWHLFPGSCAVWGNSAIYLPCGSSFVLHFTGEKHTAELMNLTKLRVFSHNGYCRWALIGHGSAMVLSCCFSRMAMLCFLFPLSAVGALVSMRRDAVQNVLPLQRCSNPLALSALPCSVMQVATALLTCETGTSAVWRRLTLYRGKHSSCLHLPELPLLQPFVCLVSSPCKTYLIVYYPLASIIIILICNALAQSIIILIIYPFTIFSLPINKYSLVCAVP